MKGINLKAIGFASIVTALVLSFNLLVGAQEKPKTTPSTTPMQGDSQQRDKTMPSGKDQKNKSNQSGTQNTSTQSDMQHDHGKSTTAQSGNTTLNSSDRKFIMEAAHGGMMEVELGRIASERGSSDDVKRFGERMVQDHGKANTDLMALASQKGITIPTDMAMTQGSNMTQVSQSDKSTNTQTGTTNRNNMGMDKEHHAMMQRLSSLSGADFDREYARQMLKDHEKDVKEFEKQSTKAKDPDVRAFAASTLPTLREHLQMARDLNAKINGGDKTNK